MFIPPFYLHQQLHYGDVTFLIWSPKMALPRQKLTFERIRRFALSEGKTTFLWDADVTSWHVGQLAEQKLLCSKAYMREKPFA
jgi:hypothetical protein